MCNVRHPAGPECVRAGKHAVHETESGALWSEAADLVFDTTTDVEEPA